MESSDEVNHETEIQIDKTSQPLQLNDEHLQKLLQLLISKEKIHQAQIEVEPGSEKGDGYVGMLTSIKVSGVGEDGKPVVLNIMAKQAPQSSTLRKQVPIKKIFEREIYVYDGIFPVFNKFERKHSSYTQSCNKQDENNSDQFINQYKRVPECYGTSLEENHEIILLENLNHSGYTMYDRMKPMDDNHVKIVLDAYAHFHAFSFALKSQQPEVFEEIKRKTMDPQIYVTDEDRKKTYNGLFDKMIEAFKTEEKIVKFLEKLKREWIGRRAEIFKQNEREDSVVIHGDCWCNNMMFKYDDVCMQGHLHCKTPTGVTLIDFQRARFSNVCSDLSYFFYCSSSEDILDYYEDYMTFYYSKLANHVKNLGSNLEGLYPFDVFKKDWMFNRTMGFVVASLMIKMMVTQKEETVDLMKNVEAGEGYLQSFSPKISNDDLYLERMKVLILHFIKTEGDFI